MGYLEDKANGYHAPKDYYRPNGRPTPESDRWLKNNTWQKPKNTSTRIADDIQKALSVDEGTTSLNESYGGSANPRNVLFQPQIANASPSERGILARQFAQESARLRNTGLSRGEGQPSIVVPNAPGTGDSPYYTEPAVAASVQGDPRLNSTGIGGGQSLSSLWGQLTNKNGNQVSGKPVVDANGFLPEDSAPIIEQSYAARVAANEFNSPLSVPSPKNAIPPRGQRNVGSVKAPASAPSVYTEGIVARPQLNPQPTHQDRLGMLNAGYGADDGFGTSW